MSLTKDLEKMYKRAMTAMEAVVETDTLQLQNYMRNNYKWTPRSHRAHQTMTGSYTNEDDGFLIALSYGVDYGIYLELAHEKRFALTHPTAKEKGPEVIKSFEGLLDKLNFKS